MDWLTKLTLTIAAAVVAIYALLAYARHARVPSRNDSSIHSIVVKIQKLEAHRARQNANCVPQEKGRLTPP
jgi:hypothetical protein